MNAERLHALVVAVRSELTGNKIDKRLETVIQHLDQVINQPQPQYQQNLATAINEFYKAFDTALTDNFSPAWRQLLEEVGGAPFVGKQLRNTVQEIFQRNQITPAVALNELRELQTKLKSFIKALDNVINGFQTLNIGDEKLGLGECEIGMLIPRKEVHNKLPEFAEELNELGFIINTFSEVVTGKVDDLTLKSISSSDLMVILKASVNVCAIFAKAVEKVVGLYKSLMELKKMKDQMGQHGLPETLIAGVEKHANDQMAAGIEQISIEVVTEHYKDGDQGRKNELVTKTRISLSRLAERIDRGFNIEVRAEPLGAGQEDKDNVTVKIQMIQQAAKNIQFLKPGGPPILKLEDAKPVAPPAATSSPPSIQPHTATRKFNL